MSPRPSVNPSDDVLVGVSQNDCEQSRIVDTVAGFFARGRAGASFATR